MIVPNCSCNDCVTTAHYVDSKAKNAGTDNISGLENGNPQAATQILWAPSKIKLIRGGDKIAHFKLRSNSKSVKAYTTCCNTSLVTCGDKCPMVSFGIPMNRSTIAPTIPAQFRSLVGEVVNKDVFPKAEDEKSKGISGHYAFAPWSAIGTVLSGQIFGTGGLPRDPATLGVLNTSVEAVTEVAGPEAYAAAGFDASKIQ